MVMICLVVYAGAQKIHSAWYCAAPTTNELLFRNISFINQEKRRPNEGPTSILCLQVGLVVVGTG